MSLLPRDLPRRVPGPPSGDDHLGIVVYLDEMRALAEIMRQIARLEPREPIRSDMARLLDRTADLLDERDPVAALALRLQASMLRHPAGRRPSTDH